MELDELAWLAALGLKAPAMSDWVLRESRFGSDSLTDFCV